MKNILLAQAFAGFLLVGFFTATAIHADDYANGYAAGFAAPRPVPVEDKVVGNLLCHYAELACPKKKD